MRSASFLPALALAALPLSATAASWNTLDGAAPEVIAHRGASGYEPEHTMASYELAALMGAAYIEPDVVITKDGVAIAMHDTSLTRTTNVEQLFPGRASYEASEFTLAEIRSLTVDITPKTPVSQSSIPRFVPSAPMPYQVPTLQEVVDFVVAFNAAHGTDIGLYPELKTADDRLNRIIVETLVNAGFDGPDDKVYIQSFDFQTLRDVQAIQDEFGSDIRTVGLGAAIFNGTDHLLGLSLTDGITLEEAASFLDVVAPTTYALPAYGVGITADYVAYAHALGLEVTAWTFDIADRDAAYDELAYYFDAGIDAFFSNYSDVARAAVDRYQASLAPVPLPASGLLLVAGLGMIAARRRRT